MTRNPRYVLVAFMAPTAPPLPTGLSDRLALIIAGLRGVLAAHMAKDRSAVEVLFLAWTRLGRLASRFEALVTAVRGGRLPAAPTPRAQAAADLELPRLEGLPQPFRLPARFGWLIRLVPGAAVYGSQVQYLLADPEMVALLADVPQAGRILRPLCRMLGIRLGPELGTKRRGGSASAASPRDSEGQPDASATGGVPPASHAGLPPSGGLEALPSPPELPGPGGAGATITAPSRLRDGNPVGAGADPPLAGPTPA
ncbi:MAG: hypothetical protein JOY71_21645 [Acetobacteraceae bacterium]|nr:hypothetical protein [Acetobacteraceae bacterium]